MSATTLRQAQQALANKQPAQARALLRQTLRNNPKEFRAWLYLAGIARTPAESLHFVSRAEALAPDHPLVARARAWADMRVEAAAESQAPVTETAPAATGAPAMQLAPEHPGAKIQPPEQTLAPTSAPVPAGFRRQRRLGLAALALITVLLLTAAAFAWRGATGEDTTSVAAVDSQVNTPAEETVREASARLSEVTAAPVAPADVIEAPLPEAAGTADDDGAENSNVAANPADFYVGPLVATPAPPPAGASAGPVKNVSSSDNRNPLPTWTPTPSPTPLPTVTPTFEPTRLNPENANAGVFARNVLVPAGVRLDERWIDVDLTNQTLNAMEGNRIVFTTLVATGTWQYPTVLGQFRIYLRYESQTMDGRYLGFDYYLPNVPHVMYFYQGYALHGAYWREEFGTPGSHGCVNLDLDAAAWLYSFADIGTLVNVHY